MRPLRIKPARRAWRNFIVALCAIQVTLAAVVVIMWVMWGAM